MKKNSQFGFTLIEIMVVIGLIGILSAVGYASFGDARKQARDKARMASLQELQLALEMYKDTYGHYPAAGCAATNPLNKWTGPGTHDTGWGNTVDCPEYIVGLVPEFMSALPRDPSREMEHNVGFLYRTSMGANAGDAYKALSHYSAESFLITNYNNEFARCPKDYDISHCDNVPQPDVYAVYSAGAEQW